MTKRVLAVVAMVAGALVFGDTVVSASGDKFALLGRGAELSAAEKEAECLVKPSKASRDLLVVLDQTLSGRRKGVGAICEGATSSN